MVSFFIVIKAAASGIYSRFAIKIYTLDAYEVCYSCNCEKKSRLIFNKNNIFNKVLLFFAKLL